MITQKELDALPEKAKRDPAVVRMYQDHDFLTAYAKHTDYRIVHNGPTGAIGAPKDWERHGNLQFRFLLEQGLRSWHSLTEIGCGTGRLARKVVPYLDEGKYTGCDLSQGALDAAWDLAIAEEWDRKRPKLVCASVPPLWRADYLWAFSVFIHLPVSEIDRVLAVAAAAMHDGSRLYFSYVPNPTDVRTGLKQFRHTLDTYQQCCARAGLTFKRVSTWRGEQQIALATLV